MKNTLIFSDVHLKVAEDDRARHAEFIAFLHRFNSDTFDRVICVGDLFDFWFEYKHVVFSGYFEVLRALAGLRDAGIELHLICGNHDLWGGRFLRDELGFHIHRISAELPFGEKMAHIVHGDGINPKDWVYRFYKRIAINPLVTGAFRLIHPDWAMAIARGVSHASRTRAQLDRPEEGPEAAYLRAYAREMLCRGDADVVFCGHAHAPVLEEYPTPKGMGYYINTGDWINSRSHVVWDGEDFHLHA